MHTVSGPTSDFAEVAQRAIDTPVRPEFDTEQAPSPQRLAPDAMTLVAHPVGAGGGNEPSNSWESASGRFVLLHDPDGVDEWEGSYRVVVFARCDVEAELLADPLIHEVAWSWVLDSLIDVGAEQLGGTVTVTSGTSFGTLTDRADDGLIEVRASWTPTPPESGLGLRGDISAHVNAWIDILAQVAGLPPLPPGVATVAARRAQTT